MKKKRFRIFFRQWLFCSKMICKWDIWRNWFLLNYCHEKKLRKSDNICKLCFTCGIFSKCEGFIYLKSTQKIHQKNIFRDGLLLKKREKAAVTCIFCLITLFNRTKICQQMNKAHFNRNTIKILCHKVWVQKNKCKLVKLLFLSCQKQKFVSNISPETHF